MVVESRAIKQNEEYGFRLCKSWDVKNVGDANPHLQIHGLGSNVENVLPQFILKLNGVVELLYNQSQWFHDTWSHWLYYYSS